MAGRVFLTKADLEKRGIPYSNTHLRRLEAAGRFPKRIRPGTGRLILWDEQEISAHQEQLLAERPPAQSPEAA
jgi:predicted DNA-binding transcriptional regulator AlpA